MTALLNFLRRLFTRRPSRPAERWAVGPVHCCNCGHTHVAVVSTFSPCYDRDSGVIDGLECPDCGLFTVCSD